MHEVSLMEQMVAIAEEQAKLHGAQRIHRIHLKIGRQSGVVPEALAFAFEVVSAGTLAANAQLTLEEVPVRCYCATCNQPFDPPDWVYLCPRCDQLSTQVLDGKQLELATLELE